MPRTLTLRIGLFEPRCGDRTEWSQEVVFKLLELLAAENRRVLKCGKIPPLYKSGVRWQKEPPDQEIFETIPDILADGHADCEDLAAWRVAELRALGEPAAFYLVRWDLATDDDGTPLPRGAPPRLLYHVQVLRMHPGRGQWTPWKIEDPSARLGMLSAKSSEERRLIQRSA